MLAVFTAPVNRLLFFRLMETSLIESHCIFPCNVWVSAFNFTIVPLSPSSPQFPLELPEQFKSRLEEESIIVFVKSIYAVVFVA